MAASQAASESATRAPELRYERYKLANGLEVLLHEDHKLPIVSVDIWYHVGPVKERAGRTGFAHLFEHMMFEGSKHVGEKAHFKYLEAAGATDINGTTSFDRTNYFETVPANELEMALWLESDRMGFLLDTLDRAKLTNQRDVVRNEKRQGEGRPYGIVDEEVYHQLFPKDPPLLRRRDRFACGRGGGAVERCARILYPVLRAQQRDHRDCRGLRSGDHQATAGEVFWADSHRAGGGVDAGARRRRSLRSGARW